MQKTRMGYYPFSDLYRDKECWSYVATLVFSRDMVLRPGAQPSLGVHNKHMRAVGMHARAAGMHAR